MNQEVTQTLQDLLHKHLNQSDFDLVDVIPVPQHADRMVRLKTLQEILDEKGEESIQYIVQVKRKKVEVHVAEPTPQKPSQSQRIPSESVYLPNGKLNTSYLIRNAKLLFETQEYNLCRNIYRAMLRAGESNGNSFFWIARCFEAEGKLEEARVNYEESITYHPTFEAYQRLSSLFIRQGKDELAAETLERALHLKDIKSHTRFEIYKSCGNSWTRAKKTVDAERNYYKALELNSTADDVRANLGVLYLQNNQTQEAKRQFQDAAASNPRNFQALAGLGSCALTDGDKKAAHDFFVQSLQIEMNNPTALYGLIKCAYDLKTYAAATQILSEYLQSAPVNTSLLYSLAGLQFQMGRFQEAKSTAEKIIKLQPGHSGAEELMTLISKYAFKENENGY